MGKYETTYDELVAAVDVFQEAATRLHRIGGLKFALQRAANIERFAISLAKFKVGDEAMIAKVITFQDKPGWNGHAQQLAKGKTVIVRDVSVDTHFEYGCQLEGRGPERSLFYMPGEWLEKQLTA